MKEREMLEDKTWEEFRDTGLMMFVNVVLQIFGWSLVYNPKDKTMIPCKSKYRGFNEKTLAKNFIKLSKYMQDNADELLEDAKN